MDPLANMISSAKKLVSNYTAGCVATALATGPIPGTSVLLTALEAKMVYDIAQIFGFSPSLQEAGVTAGSLVAISGGLKHLAIEASTFIPIVGWLVKPSIAGTACKAFGGIAIQHFVNRWYEANGGHASQQVVPNNSGLGTSLA